VPVRSVSGHFPLPNRIYPDNIFAVGIFPVGQQEISRQVFFAVGTFPVVKTFVGIFPVAQQELSRQPILLSGYFLLCNFVGIFPFGTMSGYFLLGVSGQVRSPYLMCCSSTQEDSLPSACVRGLAHHFKTEPTETVALCFG
jgi:hypothetical protein